MASRSLRLGFQAVRSQAPRLAYQQQPLQTIRCFVDLPERPPLEPPPPPPFLATLKGDLKNAMRNKDAPRLAVLRAIITHNNTMAKTKQALKNDVDLVRYIVRMQKTAEESMVEAEKAGRQDLVEKAEQEAKLLEEYTRASGIVIISEEQMHELVAQEMAKSIKDGDETKTLIADVLSNVKKLVAGKLCDNRLLVPIVQQHIKDYNKAENDKKNAKIEAGRARRSQEKNQG